ncbi:MAG: ribbon-helix-helix protein, CopG family [Chloroflexi bacterium]|nr:ribbon-helix-helix protein, CopG family [Chloroflexota bacterium]
MVRTMVQLTEEQVKALKKLAKARKTSMAQLVRESVSMYVSASAQDADREEKRRRALEFLQYIKENKEKFRDFEGKTDVAVNHDKYLEEIYGTWKKSS